MRASLVARTVKNASAMQETWIGKIPGGGHGNPLQYSKIGLKLNIQKMKIMASGSITSWQIDGEIMETVANFIFWGSKIRVDGNCSHEIKRRLLLGRKL